MKFPRSNCWCFYYSGAFGRNFPTAIAGVPCIRQNFPTATDGCFIMHVRTTLHNHRPAKKLSGLGCTSVTKLTYKPRYCFVTQCNKTVLGHRLPPLFGSVARLGTNK